MVDWRLPVVENGKLIGIITANDILRIDPGLFQMIAETIKIKEETEKLNRSHISTPRKQGTCDECGEFDILYHDESQWFCNSCYSKR
ncbi:CBS domain-containing protein [Candidatus Pacearchaeota archaeon]|nr:CBS domain-containing protein [Candidatus Pacearchaeota archaeon]